MSFFTSRRFLPLFVTQFLGAFNDNLLKNALVMLITYRISLSGDAANFLVTIAGGIFILPFFLASATSGQLADKYDRAKIARIVKWAEMSIMLVAAIGFYFHHVWLLMVVLFAMGMHSTFFGPIKYALLPQHLHDDELLAGNSWIEAGTFLAILMGTILGGIIILQPGGDWLISVALMVVAVAGYAASRFIPPAPAPMPRMKVNANIASETWSIVGYARRNTHVFRAILGISWFWLVGAVFLSQFAPLVKLHIKGDPVIVTLFLTLFSFGIGVGSFLCNILQKGKLNTRIVPYGALGITLFGIDLYFSASHTFPPSLGLMEFISSFAGLRLCADLVVLAISAGIYIVPLYALMQHESDANYRARVIAANNIINAVFMVAGTIATVALIAAGFSIPELFLTLAVCNIAAVYYGKKI